MVTEKCERGGIERNKNYNKMVAVEDRGGKKGATERSLESLGGKVVGAKSEEKTPMRC